MNYRDEAVYDAKTLVKEQLAEPILEQLGPNGNLMRVFDHDSVYTWVHEYCIDKSYTLLEAATLLDQLRDYTETDYGLWHCLEPKDAIAVQAAYTYGNAVQSLARSLVENIGEEYDTLEQGDDEADEAWDERARKHIVEYIENL